MFISFQRRALLLVMAGACSVGFAQSPRRTATVELAAKAEPCVVAIYAEGDKGLKTGSGSVIHPRGFILTNDHVVRNWRGSVLFHDGSLRPFHIIGRCPEKDIAIIQVAIGDALPALPLGRSHDIMIGEPVLAAGNPGGRGIVFSSGIVSSPRIVRDSFSALVLQRYPDDARDRFIQFDAAANPGNSGGPLINAEGVQIGIVSAGEVVEENINYAIPIDRMHAWVSRMVAPEQKGNFWVGIECNPLADRAVVAKVAKDSPAAKAGVQAGDILMGVGKEPLSTPLDWVLALHGGRRGIQSILKWQRGDQEMSASFTTAPYPVTPAEPKAETEAGLRFSVFKLDKPTRLPDFSKLQAVRTGIATDFDPRTLEPNLPSFGLVLEGLIDIQAEEWCRLIIESDDGSRVLFHGEPLLDNDGRHPAQEAGATLRVERGLHPIRIEYFELSGNSVLRLHLETPDGKRVSLTSDSLRHKK